MAFELQPHLRDAKITVSPLRPADFEALYAVASDPLIWEQHPSRLRYQREVFETFFEGALQSGGAFRVIDNETGEPIGSSRYYDLDPQERFVCIGYTFLARRVWGRGINESLKRLMLDHAFRFVDRVVFHVGTSNLRSRRAMEKLGGVLVGEEAVKYHGEPSSPNVVYEIGRASWNARAGAA